MSPNRRIFLNIIATYGRSLYALVCGVFVSRCLLSAEGKSEIGLDGVVGGMMAIEMLAGNMRRGRDGFAAVEDDIRQTYTVKHIRKGLTLLSQVGIAPIEGGGMLQCPLIDRRHTLAPL